MCPCAYMGYIGGASKTDAPFPKVGTGLLCAIKVVLFYPEFFHMLCILLRGLIPLSLGKCWAQLR